MQTTAIPDVEISVVRSMVLIYSPDGNKTTSVVQEVRSLKG